jgi:peptidoglycan/LPS O-acetylase OafA/YrhL
MAKYSSHPNTKLSNLGKTKDSHVFAHLTALDGFRGILALWVYFGHLSNAVGFKNYVLGMHALAVDLFMVLSGFLMVHTWKTPISPRHTFSFGFRTTTFTFYVNRFFRIAPLYYILLSVCYFLLPDLAEMYGSAQKMIPPPWAEGLPHFDPHISWDFSSFKWFFLHGTFTFGLIPGMEATSPLPDWSLSLEMQFYLILPILLTLFGRVPMLLLAIVSTVLAVYAPILFGNYLAPGSITHFGQPSFIPYRLNAFMAGMVVAFWLGNRQLEKASLKTDSPYVIAGLICILPLSKPVILGYFIFVLLVFRQVPLLNRLLSLKPFRLLGDISYSVYLSHLLIVTPVVYLLLKIPSFMSFGTLTRFILALGASGPLVVLVSYFLFLGIELPGIRFGKAILNRARNPLQIPQHS